MKIIIIYKSRTGFTKRYAEMIAEELSCESIDIRDVKKYDLSEYDIVIYGSRLHAGRVDGLKEIKDMFAAKKILSLVVFATGGTPNNAKDEIDAMWKNNLSTEELTSIPHFYMQGGLCYEKMSVPDRLLMKAAAAVMSKKKDKSDYEAGFENAISRSYDISSKEHIMPLVNCIKEKLV